MKIAVILTLARADAIAAELIRRHAADGGELIVAAYGAADRALLAARCAAAGNVAFVATQPDATFGEAANAGAARAAACDALAFVDAAEPLTANWRGLLADALASSGGGIAGPRIAGGDQAGSECGYYLWPAPLTLRGFVPRSFTNVLGRSAVAALPRDCLLMARATFVALGGFAADYTDDASALDFCLRARERGGALVCDPGVAFARHAATDTPSTRLRALREYAFARVWRERAQPDDNLRPELTNALVRRTFHSFGTMVERIPVPQYRVLVHGDVAPAAALAETIVRSRLCPSALLWAAPGNVPPGARACTDAVAAARELTEVRNWDGVAFVRSDCVLTREWLNELVNAIEAAPATCAATFADVDAAPEMPASADARCTLVAPRLIPQHLRIAADAPALDAGVAAWLGAAVAAGLNVARVRGSANVPGPAAVPIAAATAASAAAPRAAFASIVMLSWNAPEYTERAVASIQARTRTAHEIVIVDNGSAPAALARVRALPGVRLIENAVNTGFAFACNQGLAAARGTHAVLLNNDVIVTEGWLEALIAVQQRNPTVGCSAPRTNRIAGTQQLDAVPYGDDLAGLPAFAAARAREFRGRWTSEFRVVGFCMCLDRRVVDEIGGLDPRYGAGNFEDDDYSMRIRAAGYDIAVCEDAFIHHFGSVSFARNDVDYTATFERNKSLFARRWNVPFNGNSYDGRYPFRRGFRRARDFVPLPEPAGVGANWTAPV